MTTARVVSAQLQLSGPAGLIEASLDRSGELAPAMACVICHPHPLHQGTMHNKVVTTMSRAVARLGGLSLRFNYRGVGASQGSYDGDRGELEDALAAISYLRALPECAGMPLVVAGFSFGGAVAYRVAAEIDTDALVTVAPAWERVSADSTRSARNWLVVQGDEDEVIPANGVLQWARRHVPMPNVVSFEATGHFFHGRLPQLADTVTEHLREAQHA